MTNREQCDNCGKFVAKTIGRRYSDDTGMITCLKCAEPVESTPMDQYADYFEDIQNNGPYNFYYCDD
jgi:hypothetical protein